MGLTPAPPRCENLQRRLHGETPCRSSMEIRSQIRQRLPMWGKNTGYHSLAHVGLPKTMAVQGDTTCTLSCRRRTSSLGGPVEETTALTPHEIVYTANYGTGISSNRRPRSRRCAAAYGLKGCNWRRTAPRPKRRELQQPRSYHVKFALGPLPTATPTRFQCHWDGKTA
jgi:hypothetical protein